MKVIIGCEESGVGRREFEARGHDVVSCDLMRARDNAPNHHIGDIVEYLNSFDDLYFDLGIFHPECTYMCVAGNKHYAGSELRVNQINWTIDLWYLARKKCRKVCFENPKSSLWSVLKMAGALVQFTQPYEHGHAEQKCTGLGLYNLPFLKISNFVYSEMMLKPRHQRERIFYMAKGPFRSLYRSESYSGILGAMADQWGK